MWYLVNLIVLPADFLFVVLRPRSLASAGGDLAYLFPVFQTYAELDYLFADVHDRFLNIVYHICQPIDLLCIAYLCVNAREMVSIETAMLCIAEAMFCATKTFIYLCYSWAFIIPVARIPVTIMNSTWAVVPMLLTVKVYKAIALSECGKDKL